MVIFLTTLQKGGAKFIAKLGSSGYAMLIGLNRMVNTVLKFFNRKKVSFSKKIMLGVNKAIVKMHEFEQIAAELAIEKKYDFVICGHIHQPEKKLITTEKGSVTYLNSGDWVEHLTALEYHHNDWKIYTYNAAEFENINADEQKPVLNVVTDEIHYYINSLTAI